MSKPHIIMERDSTGWGGWCVHYRSQQHPTCEAGVAFDSVRKQVEYTYEQPPDKTVYTSRRAMPCFKRESQLSYGCAHCRYPTGEEIAARDKLISEHIIQINAARAAVVAHSKGEIGVRGSLPCLVCPSGVLYYTIAGSNGHISAQCSTPECVYWIE